MSREYLFDPHEACDVCGKTGAVDVMGDHYCFDCLTVTTPSIEDVLERMGETLNMLWDGTRVGREFYIGAMRRQLDELEALNKDPNSD